jgi:PKD repeat protein
VNATGSITVTPANTITLTSGVGTNNQTVCSGTAITSITYTTTGATGATVTGLPSGVTGNWSAGGVTISGTPSATGAFNYTVTLTGGCGAVTANGTINVNALPVTSVITGSATPACGAAGVPYSVTSTAGSTYTWTVPAGATVATGQGTNSITVNFGTTNGNVSVTERNTAGCNGAPRTLAISLQGCGLDANFSGNPLSICVGSSVTFTNTSTGTTENTTYSWSFGTGATPATITGIGPHAVTYSTTGPKTVSLTINEGASNTETKTNYITVNPTNTINLTSGAGTNSQAVCVNTAITTITYSTTGATGASFSGLPAGVTGNWASNVVTISGTPTLAGTYNYTITLTGGCGNVTANGSIIVNTCLKTLTLNSVLLEGLYNGSGLMRQAQNASGSQWPVGVADHITVELHDATNYSNIIWSAADVPLSTTGSAVISVPPAYSGTYFITIRHRNSIETTTSTAVSFSESSISRSFALRTSVFGSNLGSSGDGFYLIYGADVNQDGIVDTGDMNEVDNGSTAILIGYNVSDANGDGIVDTSDMNIVDNNSTAIVMIRLPY